MTPAPIPGESEPRTGVVTDYGCILYPHRDEKGHGRRDLTVELEDDGGIIIEWDEPVDDMWGSTTRRVSFSEDELLQILSERDAYLRRQFPDMENTHG